MIRGRLGDFNKLVYQRTDAEKINKIKFKLLRYVFSMFSIFTILFNNL